MEKYLLAGLLLITTDLCHAGIFKQHPDNIAGGSQLIDDNGFPEEMERYSYRYRDENNHLKNQTHPL